MQDHIRGRSRTGKQLSSYGGSNALVNPGDLLHLPDLYCPCTYVRTFADRISANGRVSVPTPQICVDIDHEQIIIDGTPESGGCSHRDLARHCLLSME